MAYKVKGISKEELKQRKEISKLKELDSSFSQINLRTDLIELNPNKVFVKYAAIVYDYALHKYITVQSVGILNSLNFSTGKARIIDPLNNFSYMDTVDFEIMNPGNLLNAIKNPE